MPGDGSGFFATGVSLVLHPLSPMVPTVHANFRYLEHGRAVLVRRRRRPHPLLPVRGGRPALPPRSGKAVCDRHAPLPTTPASSDWCDEYFFLPHRGEARGVGGIFFDYLRGRPRARCFALRAGRRARLPRRLPADRRAHACDAAVGRARSGSSSSLRRGRYVEFNLLYDRGTVFGLKTGGRTESILMSLPPLVRWPYDFHPAPGSREALLLEALRRPRDWCAEPPGPRP